MQIQHVNQPPQRFAESIRQSIDNEVSKGKNTVEKGRLFLRWVLTKVFHATEDDAENGRLDGPNDQGMDAILEFEGTEINFFRIFQAKYGTSHSVDAIHAFKSKVFDLLAQKPNELAPGRIREALINIKKKSWECEAIYVTDQKVDFKSSDDFHALGFDQIVEMLWNEITEPAAEKVETIGLIGNYAKHDNTIIGTISLSELGNLVLRSRKYIFESNIRKFLSIKTKVNKQLRESLIKEPEEVFYYNNGITIVVKSLEELVDNKIKLYEPQIVNGAQTSSTIADVVRGDPNVQGKIQITIIQETIRTTRNNITKYRNSQNAVKGKDLISLELFHRSIFGQLKNRLGYFYEQQAGSWMALTDKEQESFLGNATFNKYLPEGHYMNIPANDALQAMAAAIKQDPATPYGNVAKYMPGGKEYDKIFSEDMIPDDYRLLLYPYLVKSYCEKEFEYGSSKANMSEKKYARLLFVTTYFKVLKEQIIRKDVVLTKNPSVFDPYFENFETNKKLLHLINEILEQFFDQSVHIHRDDDDREIMTLHNFFARHVWGTEARRILSGIIKRKKGLEEIKKEFKI